jgi:hypothetical protein
MRCIFASAKEYPEVLSIINEVFLLKLRVWGIKTRRLIVGYKPVKKIFKFYQKKFHFFIVRIKKGYIFAAAKE